MPLLLMAPSVATIWGNFIEIGLPMLEELGEEDELKTCMESSSILKVSSTGDSPEKDSELLLSLQLLSTLLLWVTVDFDV